MRPEVWPFLGAYGFWLWQARAGAWVIAAGAIDAAAVVRPGRARRGRRARRLEAPGAASRARAARSSPTSRCSRCCGTPRRCSRSRPLIAARVRRRGADARLDRGGRRGVGGDRGGDDRRRLRREPALPRRGRRRSARRARPGVGRRPRRDVARRSGRRRRRRAPLPRAAPRASPRRSAPRSSSRPSSPSPSATSATRSRELDSRAAAAGAFDGVLAKAGGQGRAAGLLARPDEQPRALARGLASSTCRCATSTPPRSSPRS